MTLGEFKERYRVMNHSKPTLSEAEARSAVHNTAVPRNVQRLGHRALRPLTATSAQPCSATAGEEIVHESRHTARAKARGLAFFDTLIRTAGQTPGVLTDTTALFTSNGARTEATTNLINGSTLPSDQSHVTLALRVFTWFRNPILRIAGGAPGETATTGDFDTFAPWLVGGPAVGQAAGTVQDVYRLHSQAEEQLHWTFNLRQRAEVLAREDGPLAA